MRTAIVIPARYASSRLPAKPLLRETGKYLVQHVYERACQSSAVAVVVATDDVRIVQAVRSFGGRVAMTRADHASGHGLRAARVLDGRLVGRRAADSGRRIGHNRPRDRLPCRPRGRRCDASGPLPDAADAYMAQASPTP